MSITLEQLLDMRNKPSLLCLSKDENTSDISVPTTKDGSGI